MSDFSKDSLGPRSDFSSSLDKEVEVRFRHAEYAEKIGLGASLRGRLVGVERFGLWVEPAQGRQQALQAGENVDHYFVPWDEVLTVIRSQPANLFQEKKEYRGLRPS